MSKVTIDALEKAITEKRGNLAAVGRSFGIHRSTVSKRVKNSVRLQKAWDEARETMLDNAETELYDQALDGNTTALLFFLKTQGKSRGYVERQEQVMSGQVETITRIVENRSASHSED